MYDAQFVQQYFLDLSDGFNEMNVELWEWLNAVGE